MVRVLRVVVLATALSVALPVMAGTKVLHGPAAVRERVESSMLVRGTLQIETDGSVSAVQIERQEKIPEGVAKIVRNAAAAWRFKPVEVNGEIVRVSAPMSVRVVARKLEGGSYEISLRGASFDKYDDADPHNVARLTMPPPRYPERAFRAGASGNVYLLVKVGRDGRVADVAAEQVNLRIITRESDQRILRDMFADSAVAAARRWTFRVPTEGSLVAQEYWNVRVPVSYSLGSGPTGGEGVGYGSWVSYVPGPFVAAPWVQEKPDVGFSPDTLADGGVYLVDGGKAPQLLTPLQGS